MMRAVGRLAGRTRTRTLGPGFFPQSQGTPESLAHFLDEVVLVDRDGCVWLCARIIPPKLGEGKGETRALRKAPLECAPLDCAPLGCAPLGCARDRRDRRDRRDDDWQDYSDWGDEGMDGSGRR
jgi:hypothetical protein